MKRLAQSILLAISCVAANASTYGPADFSSKFVTLIQCKTFTGRLVSTCSPTRPQFGPPICTVQTLQIDAPTRTPARVLFKVRGTKSASIKRHAFHWRCFKNDENTEVLSLDIVDIENSRDEDVWLFNLYGTRFSKQAESQVFRSSAWQAAKSGEQLTGQGVVKLPAINE